MNNNKYLAIIEYPSISETEPNGYPIWKRKYISTYYGNKRFHIFITKIFKYFQVPFRYFEIDDFDGVYYYLKEKRVIATLFGNELTFYKNKQYIVIKEQQIISQPIVTTTKIPLACKYNLRPRNASGKVITK